MVMYEANHNSLIGLTYFINNTISFKKTLSEKNTLYNFFKRDKVELNIF
jgi:hypothetical protein